MKNAIKVVWLYLLIQVFVWVLVFAINIFYPESNIDDFSLIFLMFHVLTILILLYISDFAVRDKEKTYYVVYTTSGKVGTCKITTSSFNTHKDIMEIAEYISKTYCDNQVVLILNYKELEGK